MRVAILHFHLRQGGVTRIVEMAVTALLEQGFDPLVISGEPAPAGCRLSPERVAVVPDLAYDIPASRAENLREGIEAAMHKKWGAPADVIHCHNHALGKNFALPLAVTQWTREGRALVLQIHDFAENGRPANYQKLLAQLGDLSRSLYPVSPRVGYALLSSGDCARLQSVAQAGLCCVLPNPVALPPGGQPIEKSLLGAEKIIVYPTRAIRRKNLGEALLWATQSPPGEKIVLTAAPESPHERTLHDEWRAFAAALNLPVVFDAQTEFRRPLIDFIHGADTCLTTSVGEGFGMAFLEPWAAGRAVVGRDLPSVTQDFQNAGLQLDLYDRLGVPLEWLEDLTPWLRSQLRAACAAYQVEFDEEFTRQALSALIVDARVDFGRLAESHQRTILKGIAEKRFDLAAMPSPQALRASVAGGSPSPSPGLASPPQSKIDHNRQAVAEAYSLTASGERLIALYHAVTAASAGEVEFLNPTAILHAFLRFDDFFALRG